MHPIKRSFLLGLTACAFTVLFNQSGVAATGSRESAVVPPSAFAPTSIEYYLADDQLAWIRPGVNITIVSITDAVPGKKPVVEFTLTDDLKQPLDRWGAVTPGVITTSFVFGKWDPVARYYVPLTFRNGTTGNPSADRGGVFTDLAIGSYKYTFGTTMLADMDVTATNTLGAYASRPMAATGLINKTYYAPNVFKETRADGGTPGPVWDAMAMANSCNRCHDTQLTAAWPHGGSRRSVKMCMMCHSSYIGNDSASGNTFNGKVFFHKLHRGENLPSVIAGTPYIAGGDWSTVAYPQDMRNCVNCHDPKATEANIWYTRPTRLVCGSCHDDINFATGVGHYGLPQVNDNSCKNCHDSVQNAEWDISVKGAHTVPAKSTQLKGLNATIDTVTNFVPGQKPTAVFKVTNGDKSVVDATKLSTFSPILAGPTTDYSGYWRENAIAKAVFDPAAGTTSYTFTNAIPATATGTWTVSLDAYRNVALVRGDGKPDMTQRECASNPIWYGSVVTGKATVARRTVVALANCNKCHDQLALHGGQRLVVQECVICHNPKWDDSAMRPAAEGPAESIDFKRMIHRIHTGEELEQDLTIYGFGNSKNNYNEVRYPGDRRNCVACHTSDSTRDLPPGGNLDTITLRDYMTPQGPGTTSCLGCHDKRDNVSHAYINTSSLGESCSTCHGPNSDWSPSKVHAR